MIWSIEAVVRLNPPHYCVINRSALKMNNVISNVYLIDSIIIYFNYFVIIVSKGNKFHIQNMNIA